MSIANEPERGMARNSKNLRKKHTRTHNSVLNLLYFVFIVGVLFYLLLFFIFKVPSNRNDEDEERHIDHIPVSQPTNDSLSFIRR